MENILDKVKDKIFSEIEAAADDDQVGFEILRHDPYLKPYWPFFFEVRRRVRETKDRLTGGKISLKQFASGHEYFGLHFEDGEWIFREWAPNATAIFLIGEFSGWQKKDSYMLHPIGEGVWEVRLQENMLHHYDHYRLWMEWNGGAGERLPTYVRRVVQDYHSKVFSAQVWRPENPYQWKIEKFKLPKGPLLIYETHVGMAQQEEKIGSYLEFKEKILPRIVDAGYNTIQIMGIQEHPYYGSFGYQVSNFFASSFRYGTPEELKELIDAAHQAGCAVLLDLVQSHAVKNEVEGISKFDGTHHQFFHEGDRGEHPVWDSRLFNYGKTEVLHFLLSNVNYWLDAFKFDGFRFDGVTSMLYHDHGLGDPFCSYDSYFGDNLDKDALVYMMLANELAHEDRDVITIAEDVSGMPGLAAPLEHGGAGFDYRLAMGIPDFWTKTIEEQKDEDWNVEGMFWELINRRSDEKTISYAESHDQALVGDQNIIFRLLQTLVYDSMRIEQQNHLVERGMALHCMIRLLTVATAGHGYLNFMGNEFGHPEWIDFPREGNNWSYHHARRLWHLRDNPELQYHRLADFDKVMLSAIKQANLFDDPIVYKHHSHVEDQTLVFSRGGLLFFFNFNGQKDFHDYSIKAPVGKYQLLLASDQSEFGGPNRMDRDLTYSVISSKKRSGLKKDEMVEASMKVFFPARTAFVMKKTK